MDKGGLEASADEEVQVLVGESQDGTVTTFLAEAGNPPAAAVELPPTKRTSGAVVASDVVSPAKKASRTAEAEAEAAEDIEDVLWDAPFAVPATPPIPTGPPEAVRAPADPKALCAAATAARQALPEWEVSGNKRWLYARDRSQWFNYGLDHTAFAEYLQQQLNLRLQRSSKQPLLVQDDWQQHQQQTQHSQQQQLNAHWDQQPAHTEAAALQQLAALNKFLSEEHQQEQ
ncbi:uncharacterized protein LOC34621923 [Cyclospora cayetanensis]|uniref:Uncharacterized protein LOC34621923 n=1 Tax=Cyclospora cayetanensis TaxID=88456 RepID=A0A6P6RYC0_9EIME|nr:uncharacterized protein LOC34621923 [Cyclospora cayetanensis]